VKIGFNLYLRDGCISGVEYYSLAVIRALCASFPSDCFVAFTNRPDILDNHGCRGSNLIVRKASYNNSRLFRILWEHTALPRVAEREGLDVLHSPAYICPLSACRIPYVVTVHDTIALDHPEWCTVSNAAYYALTMRRALRKAAHIVAVSNASAAALRRQYAGDHNKITVVTSGVDDAFFGRCSTEDGRTIRGKYGLPARYILHVGNIEPKKNIAGLLRAYSLLRKRGFEQALVLVGGRHWRSRSILKTIRCGEFAGSVFTPGYVDRADLPGVYQMADVYACTSFYEGFGFPPLEAMACGVPVVSSKRGALAEVLGDAALSIDPDKPESIAAGLVELLSDEQVRAGFVRCGTARAHYYDWKKTARELHDIYHALVA